MLSAFWVSLHEWDIFRVDHQTDNLSERNVDRYRDLVEEVDRVELLQFVKVDESTLKRFSFPAWT
eukprot:12906803-Prorocentrum_lima.AAC.1